MDWVLGTANLEQNYGLNSNYLTEKHFESILQSEKCSAFFAIDTSPAYGMAEQICNRVVTEPTRIYSKLQFMKSKKTFGHSELKNNELNIILIHNWQDLTSLERVEALSRLDYKKRRGLIAGFGFSTYDEFCDEEILFRFPNLYIQAPINVINQTNHTLMAEIKRGFPNTTMLARSVFLQGLLTKSNKYSALNEHSDILKFKESCRDLKISSTNVAIEFVLRQSFIDGLVLGVNSSSEWIEIKDINLKPRNKVLDCVDWSELQSFDQNLIDPRRWP